MQGVTKPPHSSSLAQVVCDWQPSKLSELAKAYSDACAPPEVTFSSYDSYKAYFEPLLLAEVVADVLSAFDKFQRSQPARQPKVRARREEPGTNVAVVIVGKVTRQHPWGFGWTVDLESHDRKGPVGCVNDDVVVLWRSDRSQTEPKQTHSRSKPPAPSRIIPDTAVHAVVVRTPTRNGCRLVLSNFPDGNELGIRTDLEDGEENEDGPPSVRIWNLLRLGSLTTMKREFDALQSIKTSVLLPTLLRPKLQQAGGADREREDTRPASEVTASDVKSSVLPEKSSAQFRNEQTFTHVIASKTGLNPSQARAVLHASTCRNGFSVIQGPPGTGKTKTLISLLNVIHMTQYQEYYEGLLASFASTLGMNFRVTNDEREDTGSAENVNAGAEKLTEGGFLQSMLVAMNKTAMMLSTGSESKLVPISKRARRPRLLICAPSNSAVDEILTRLTRCKFTDGQGREYCPELARIGAGDRVSEAAKPFTAEGQAETFLDRLCSEDMNADAQKKAQMAFLTTWQNRCNSLLVQLARTSKKQPSSRPIIIDLHEKLERMDRDLRRLSIAASDGEKALTREEKLRQIARTYVEDAQLVFATLSGSASSILTKKGMNDMTGGEGALFDTVVIDEGAQATEPSCLIPMALGASRCLLVGDPQQLPATVLSSGAAGLAYGQSLLERVCKGGQDVQLLDTQYRMHPAISSFPRRYFYHGRLVDDESVQGENRARPYHRDEIRPRLGPYVFLDIAEGEERRCRDDRSIFNRSEAELASLIYSKLKKEYPTDSLFSAAAKVQGSVTGFGVVTPYKRQMQELRQSFDRAGIPTGDVEIDTVDSFQGREKDVIVFSCVRTAAVNRGIGFVRDVRRMNVGLTRARSSLIILGSAQALAEGSADWAELVEDANSRGCLISVSSVSRCLLPPAPATPGDDLAAREAEEAASRSKKSTVGEPGPGASVGSAPTSSERKAPGTVPSDPRRRAPKRGQLVDPNATASQKLSIRSGDPRKPSHQAEGTMPSAFHSSGLQRDQLISQSSGAGGADVSQGKNAELQSTLAQMSKLLAEAGFQNVSGIEQTLREHVRNGGKLELEAVMAAAVTTHNASSEGFMKDDNQFTTDEPAVKPKTEVVRRVSALDEKQRTDKDGDVGQGIALKAEKQNHESELQRGDGKPSKAVPKEQFSLSDRSAKSKTGVVRSRMLKPSGRDKLHDMKRDNAGESGWDMLFEGKKKGSIGENGHGSNKKENALCSDSEAKVAESSHTKGDEKIDSVTPDTSGIKQREQSDAVTATPTSPKSSDEKSSKRKDEAQIVNSKVRKNWDGNGRESDRKRQRSNDFSDGVNMRGGYRSDRGRGRPRRGRGRGSFSRERGRDIYVSNEAWGPTQYDHGYGSFPVAGSGMDPGMGSTQAVDAMHVIQQQQALQQAFQQQAMQQQALQHQLRQQALQQETMMQQAAMIQMPGGVPMNAVPPHAYQVGFDSVGPRDQGRSQRDGRSYSGRGSRGGRGRGRMKYGSRTRRGG